MKLFSYSSKDNAVKIGIEIDRLNYNFTQLWEFYKDYKGLQQLPQLTFLQMMVETDLFHQQYIQEIITTVQNFRSLDDLQIKDLNRFEVPLARPPKMLFLGRNYLEHAKEGGHAAPSEPIFFAKLPSTLISHQSQIRLPAGVGRVDHEIELAMIIGKQGKNISEAKAWDYIAGFTIINDITARALQKSDMEKKHPWLRSKNFDTFCPMGPFLVPTAAIPDAQNLDLQLTVNGQIKQQSNTSNMIFKIPKIIAYISQFVTLSPGDIIATGTPEGISELHSGDIIVAEIDGLGALENSVA